MKKSLVLIIVLSILLCVFSGCGSSDATGNNANSGVVSGNSSVNEFSKTDVVFVNENNESVYRIIRPEAGEMEEDLRASELFKKAKSTLGVSVKNTDDSVEDNDTYEILIGNTNRPESQQAMEYMFDNGKGRYTDYIICSIGKKIVINAHSTETLKLACDYFIENYLKAEGVKGGIDYIYSPEDNYSDFTINGVNISKFKFIRPHLNSSYLTWIEMENVGDTVKSKTGYLLKIYDDEYTEEAAYEIIVGDNNRNGVEAIPDLNEYRITIKGNKVYLNGGSPHATAMAVSEFGKLLEKGTVTDADSVVGNYETAYKNYDSAKTYALKFYDEFEGNKLDTTKWRMMGGTEFGRKGQNDKMSYMSDDPKCVYQKDGKFYINAQEKEDAYYGGCILNDNIMVFRYGYVEMSALCPDGPGFWSLIYFYQPDNSKAGPFVGANQGYYCPEIDLNECFGNGRMTYFNCHAHITDKGDLAGKTHISFDNSPYKSDRIYYCPDGKTFADDFHTYGLIWDETKMAMVADGKVYFTYYFTEDYDIDAFVETYLCMKIAFSVARENNNLDINQVTEEQWENSSTMIIDYVYLYQFNDGIQDLIYLK